MSKGQIQLQYGTYVCWLCIDHADDAEEGHMFDAVEVFVGHLRKMHGVTGA